MPSLFSVCGYRVFFWSNESNEPVHVHVCKGAPSGNSTKLWLTKSGGCVVASNAADIPRKELQELVDVVAAQHELICREWKRFFVVDEVAFFC